MPHKIAFGIVDSIDRELVIDVLSVFVLIELFHTFTDYLEFHHVRLRALAEVGIAFVLRVMNHEQMNSLLQLSTILL